MLGHDRQASMKRHGATYKRDAWMHVKCMLAVRRSWVFDPLKADQSEQTDTRIRGACPRIPFDLPFLAALRWLSQTPPACPCTDPTPQAARGVRAPCPATHMCTALSHAHACIDQNV